jgi:hypothetical protein
LPARTVLFADEALSACASQLAFVKQVLPHPATDTKLSEILSMIATAQVLLSEINLDG